MSNGGNGRGPKKTTMKVGKQVALPPKKKLPAKKKPVAKKTRKKADGTTAKSNAGRKLTLDKTVVKALEKYVRSGLYNDQACAMLGISEAIFYRWKNQGELDRNAKKRTIFVELVEALEVAGKYNEAYLQSLLMSVVRVNPQSLKFALQIRNHDRYTIREKLDIDSRQQINFILPDDPRAKGLVDKAEQHGDD